MKVTEVRVTKVEDKGSLKAFASICLDGVFVVDGFRVVEKDDNVMVFMPEKSKRNADGTFSRRNTAYPTDPALREDIVNSIKAAYEAE
jgi:stage V sporulation protein G